MLTDGRILYIILRVGGNQSGPRGPPNIGRALGSQVWRELGGVCMSEDGFFGQGGLEGVETKG